MRLLILFGILNLSLPSCVTLEEKLLVGKWEVYEVEIIKPVVDEETEKATKDIVKSYRYHFEKDGVLLYEDEYIKNANGEWSLNGAHLKFSYVFKIPGDFEKKEKKHEFKADVISVNKSKMEWIINFEDGSSFKYYLRKIE